MFYLVQQSLYHVYVLTVGADVQATLLLPSIP